MKHCAENEKAYKSFMNNLMDTKKGIERNSYMEGHKDANLYLLKALETIPNNTEDYKEYLEALRKGADFVIKCVDRIKKDSEE